MRRVMTSNEWELPAILSALDSDLDSEERRK